MKDTKNTNSTEKTFTTKVTIVQTIRGKAVPGFPSSMTNPDRMEREVYVNDKEVYAESCRAGFHTNTEVERFLAWLSGKKETGNDRNISKNRAKKISFFRKGFLKRLYLKLKLIESRFFNGLFSYKSSFSVKVKSLSLKSNEESATKRIKRQKIQGFKLIQYDT